VSNIAAPQGGNQDAILPTTRITSTSSGPFAATAFFQVDANDIDDDGAVRIRVKYQATAARTIRGTDSGYYLRITGRGPFH
jgi:hypothetical protein